MIAEMRSVRCGRCGTHYSPHAYAALAPVMTLERQALGAVVSEWPAEVTVHVRECGSCARPIACLARPASGS